MSFFDKFIHNRYCTRISEVDDICDLFEVSKHKTLKDFNTPFLALPNNSVTIADPFLFVHGDTLFLFYEEQISFNKRGVIRMRSTTDLNSWSKPVTVLEEPFHLSFPHVFEDKGRVFMIPESCIDQSIRLYEGKGDFKEWKFNKILLSGEKFVDSVLFKNSNQYFLFVTIQLQDKSYIQDLYVSDSLFGEWKKHRASPIATGKVNGRNGGNIIEFDNNMYRVSQNCSVLYGSQLDVYKIEILNSNIYKESLYARDIIQKRSFSMIGGHHFSAVIFGKKTLVATDALMKSLNSTCIWKRIMDKFN
jgi:hypothetical protein